MISNVVVSYSVKPETVDEHLRLINGVFDQLRSDAVPDADYTVMQLEDGVSFVHVSSADTQDGSHPIPELTAFKEFVQNLGDRVVSPPDVKAATLVGTYTPGHSDR